MTNDLPSVGTEDARPMSTEGARAHADFLDFAGLDKAANVIRALVSERDALAGRVAELEAALREAQRQLNADAPNCALDTIDAALTTPESKP